MAETTSFATGRGRPLPLGTTPGIDGHNFALLCRHGTRVTLVILPETGGTKPLAEFSAPPEEEPHRRPLAHPRRGAAAHLLLRLARRWPATAVARASTRTGCCSTPRRRCSRTGPQWAGTCEVDPQRTSRRSLYHRGRRYNWDDDAPPLTPHEDSIIYELHVRGFTCHPSRGVAHPGTFRGLIEKIPYLQWLGVTAVELLPVHEFDECDCPFTNPETGEKLRNFWGYNTIAFAAPKAAYAATRDGARPDQRVPRHGQGAPRRRHRGHPRRRLQPHRRGRRPRPDLFASAAWTTSSTTCSTRTAGT